MCYIERCVAFAGRGRGRRTTGAPSKQDKKSKAEAQQQANALRKQSYSLFLKQRAVLFSAKKWK